jgi:hypothetical protein
MTGVTEVVRRARRAYWQGRFSLLALIAYAPAFLRPALRSALMMMPGESRALANPVGDMPMPRLEFFKVIWCSASYSASLQSGRLEWLTAQMP